MARKHNRQAVFSETIHVYMHTTSNNIIYGSLNKWRMHMGFKVEKAFTCLWILAVWSSALSSANLLEDRNHRKIWNICLDGNFTIKSSSYVIDITEFNDVCFFQTRVWISTAPLKIQIFIWLIVQGRIYTGNLSSQRGLLPIEFLVCPLCTIDMKNNIASIDSLLICMEIID